MPTYVCLPRIRITYISTLVCTTDHFGLVAVLIILHIFTENGVGFTARRSASFGSLQRSNFSFLSRCTLSPWCTMLPPHDPRHVSESLARSRCNRSWCERRLPTLTGAGLSRQVLHLSMGEPCREAATAFVAARPVAHSQKETKLPQPHPRWRCAR